MNQKPNTKRILVVDDEPGIRDSLKDFFEIEDYQVVTAQSGNEALSLIESSHFDLVLSDIRMPNGDGRFLLKSIRSRDPSKPIVLLMSGFSDLPLDEAFAEGASDLISKPFNPTELLKSTKYFLQDLNERWMSANPEQVVYNTKVQASTLQEAIEKEFLKFGLGGVFLKIDPAGFRTGEMMKIQMQDSQFHITGRIRWVRAHEKENRPKGMGLEILNLSDKLLIELLTLIKSSKTKAIIPLG